MMKKGNNKGFSLVEIMIGIGMLAVIVIPILHAFITSARLNRDSRQIMIQTEVAQTIMEGFAGKTYAEVKDSVNALKNNSSGVVSGDNALSSIDDNWFNTAGTFVEYDDTGSTIHTMPNLLQSVSRNEVIWNTEHIQTRNLVSDNSVIVSMNNTFGKDLALWYELSRYTNSATAGDDQRYFTSWESDGGAALFIAYGDIHYEGYRFDAVVSFLPMAQDADDKYYTYRILLTLYELNPTPYMDMDNRFQHVLMVMDGGIMAGKLL